MSKALVVLAGVDVNVLATVFKVAVGPAIPKHTLELEFSTFLVGTANAVPTYFSPAII